MAYFRLLGRVALEDERGRPALENRKPLLILGLLLISQEGSVSRSELARWIWPSSSAPRESVRTALAELRALRVISEEGDRVALSESLGMDLWDYRAAVASRCWARADRLYGGAPFAEMIEADRIPREMERWIDETIGDEIFSLQSSVLEGLATLANATGSFRAAETAARRLIGHRPGLDTGHGLLVDALTAQDRFAEARAALEGYRRVDGDASTGPADALLVWQTRLADEGRTRVDPTERTSATTLRSWSGPLRPRLAAGAAAVVGALLLVLATLWDGAARASAAQTITLPIVVRRPDEQGEVRRVLAELSVRDGESDIKEIEVAPTDFVVQPGGRRWAATQYRETGDLMVGGEGDLGALLKDGPAEERPVAWSPIQPRLLYRSGARQPGGDYAVDVAWIDVETREEAPFVSFPYNPGLQAVVSPHGNRVALRYSRRAGGDSLLLLDATGDTVFGPIGVAPATPAWSPRGARLAFVIHGEGHDGDRIRLMDRDGASHETLEAFPGKITSLAWPSEEVLFFTADVGYGGDVWVKDLVTGELGQMTTAGNVASLRQDSFGHFDLSGSTRLEDWSRVVKTRDDIQPPLDDLRLVAVTSPYVGEVFQVTPQATVAGGPTIRLDPEALEWRHSDLVRRIQGGLFQVLAPGDLWIRATSPRGDVAHLGLTALTRPVPAEGAQLVFSDSWTSSGDLEGSWLRFGEPAPFIEPVAGDRAGILHVAGDDEYNNGVVLSEPLDSGAEWTVEVEARVPFTRPHFQGFTIALTTTAPSGDSIPDRWDTDSGLEVMFHPTAGLHVYSRGKPVIGEVPLPPGMGTWRRYTFQVDPSGSIALLIDGQVYLRTDVGSLPESPHVVVGGVSLDTDITVGSVQVYAGPRFAIESAGRAPT